MQPDKPCADHHSTIARARAARWELNSTAFGGVGTDE